MRVAWMWMVLGAVACSGDDAKDTVAATDTSAGGTGLTDTTPSGPHPLVPDEYQYIWDTDGCTTYDGASGVNVYWYAIGSADESGHLVMEERWFWFMGQGDVEQDCVDTFLVEGDYEAFDMNQLGCGACEEGYQVTRTLTEDNCGVDYGSTFGTADEPGEHPYVSLEMLDTLSSWGKPNWENVMDTSHADPIPPGQETYWAVSLNWARGHVLPWGAPGYPSDYDWVGESCYQIN
jgi:hypothetical protein